METHDSYGLILIGLLIRFFRSISEVTTVADTKSGIKGLERELRKSEFRVSLAGMDNIDVINKIKSDLENKSDNEPIGKEMKTSLNHIMESIENIVFSEAKTRKIFVIPQRRYNGDFLLNRYSELLKPNVFEKLSEMAQYDFGSACRCLIFGESTACAFHILRATEDTLKQYYYRYIKNKRLTPPMWSPMTLALRAKKKNKPEPLILNSLDIIRTAYRNPTQHPEVRYDIDSAQDLLGLCIDVLNKMALSLN